MTPFVVGICSGRSATPCAVPYWQKAVLEIIEYLRSTLPHTPICLLTFQESPAVQKIVDTVRETGVQIRTLGQSTSVEIEADTITNLPDAPASIDWQGQNTFADAHAFAWLCRLSHLLIALDDLDQGTSQVTEVIRFRLESIPPSLGKFSSLLDAPETGPMIRLGPDQAISEAWLMPQGQSLEDWRRTMCAFDQLNKVAESVRSPHFCDAHSTAASLSDLFAKLRRRFNLFILILSVAGAVSLEFYSPAFGNFPMADVYAVFFFAIGTLYLIGRRFHFNERYVDFSVLSLGLSIQSFWNALGSPSRVAEQLLPRHRRQIPWVAEALKSADLTTTTFGNSGSALTCWLKNEHALCIEQGRIAANKAFWLERAVWGCYALAGSLSILLHFFPSYTPAELRLVTAIGSLASLGTLLLIFRGAMDFSGHTATMRQMAKLIEHALEIAERNLPAHEISELIEDIGRELLEHKTEWLLRQR